VDWTAVKASRSSPELREAMLLAIGLDSAVRCLETRIGRARSPWSLVVEAGSGDGGDGGDRRRRRSWSWR
jgi:hypothetical protein